MSKSPLFLGGKNYDGNRHTDGWKKIDKTAKASEVVAVKLSKGKDIDDFNEEKEFENVDQRLRDYEDMIEPD